MHLNEVYFWTSTIYQWKYLLQPDKYKKIITDSLCYLVEKKKIKVYGFIIMPNHIHLLWEMTGMNGKETPYASFQKYTAHSIQADLKISNEVLLSDFRVKENERDYRFWQRDPLAVQILNREMAEQKLDYMHLNPLQKHWCLCSDPQDYFYSSILFYESYQSNFNFLSDYRERL